jgi:hypothetical protein
VEPDLSMKDAQCLYYGSDSLKWMAGESRLLMGMMGPEYETLAATGANPVGDIFGSFPVLWWDRLK